MDFIGPLPETPDGKDFILTCVCLLTKMVKLVPMRRPDADWTARAFNERVLSQMGWPRVVVSDRDPKFMSAFWQRLMQLMRTRLNTSTAYHPQTDGQAERMNRLVGEVLRHFVCADQTDWDELLPMVEFAINSSPNRSTGFTPFYLNYGRPPCLGSARPTWMQYGVGRTARRWRSCAPGRIGARKRPAAGRGAPESSESAPTATTALKMPPTCCSPAPFTPRCASTFLTCLLSPILPTASSARNRAASPPLLPPVTSAG